MDGVEEVPGAEKTALTNVYHTLMRMWVTP